jgi:hypothetical protein
VIIGGALALLGIACGPTEGKDPDGRSQPQKNAGPKPIETRGAGASVVKDEDHNGVPDPWEAQDDFGPTLKVATISVWLEPDFCPYTVDATATDPHTGQVSSLTGDGKSAKWVVSEGQWRQTVGYPPGEGWVINIKVQARRPGSANGYIAIRDGDHIHRSWSFNRTAVASAEYTCAR